MVEMVAEVTPPHFHVLFYGYVKYYTRVSIQVHTRVNMLTRV